MIDWLSVGIGVAAAILFGALAIYLSVYRTPSSDKMIAALVDAAQKLLDAAVKALVKQMEYKNAQAAARNTYDPVPEARMASLQDVADALYNWRAKK
jgi:hypothetical protein